MTRVNGRGGRGVVGGWPSGLAPRLKRQCPKCGAAPSFKCFNMVVDLENPDQKYKKYLKGVHKERVSAS